MMREGAIKCSIRLDPDLDQIKEAHRIDVQGVELSADAYVAARDRESARSELQRFSDAAKLAAKFGLQVAIGHGLTARNIPPLLGIPGLIRLNVGYSLVARSVMVGFEKAVGEMVDLLDRRVPPAR
jgi:pyridoxine 5-phosphate synthase